MRTDFQGTVISNRRAYGFNSITIEQSDGKLFFFTIKSQQLREGWIVKGTGQLGGPTTSGATYLERVKVRRQSQTEPS